MQIANPVSKKDGRLKEKIFRRKDRVKLSVHEISGIVKTYNLRVEIEYSGKRCTTSTKGEKGNSDGCQNHRVAYLTNRA